MSSPFARILDAATGGLSSPEEAASNNLISYWGRPLEFMSEILKVELTEDIKKFVISVQENTATIAQSGNALGKTHVLACIAVYFLLCAPDSAQVYITAAPPEDNLRRLTWGEVVKITEKHPAIFGDCIIRRGSMDITKKNDSTSYITCVTIPSVGTPKEREARFSGKHAPYLLFIVDEGDAVANEVYDGIESCMSGGFARLAISFNPRARAGVPYNKIKKKAAKVIILSGFDHPNVVFGEDIIPGAITQNSVVFRIMQWTRPLRDEEETHHDDVFEVPHYLVGVKAISQEGTLLPALKAGHRKVVDPRFSYMVLARFPSQAENQLIDHTSIVQAVTRHAQRMERNGRPNVPGIIGHDVADLGDDTNVLLCRYDFFVDEEITQWSKINVLESARKAAEIIKYTYPKVKKTFVDANGAGAATVPILLEEKVEAFRVMFQKTPPLHESSKNTPTYDQNRDQFYKYRDYLIWQIKLWVERPDSCLPNDDELIDEMLAVRFYRRQEDNKICVSDREALKKLVGRSPDKLMALALTFGKEDENETSKELVVHNYLKRRKTINDRPKHNFTTNRG